MLNGGYYILKNVYNANTESLLNFFDISQDKSIIFAGVFNIFFSSKLGSFVNQGEVVNQS